MCFIRKSCLPLISRNSLSIFRLQQGDQLVVVGGLTSADLLCDQPGVYVLNTTDSSWSSEFRTGGKVSR